MKTFLFPLLSMQVGLLTFTGDFNLFLNAFFETILDLGLFCAVVLTIIFAVATIKRNSREREIAKALKSKFVNGVAFVVLKSSVRRELKDFFHESSNIKYYFDHVEVVLNGKIFEVPKMIPVKITKFRLSNKTLKVYVNVVELECDFYVTWFGKSFGEKLLGDDAMRVNLLNINFGNQQVSRQESQIPENVKKGDKLRMKFVKNGRIVKLMFVKTL